MTKTEFISLIVISIIIVGYIFWKEEKKEDNL